MFLLMLLHFLKSAEVGQSINIIKTPEGVVARSGPGWLTWKDNQMTFADLRELRDWLDQQEE
jgi:hypothetical protein